MRIQRGQERESYGVTYREAQQAIEAEIPAKFDARTRAYLLLKPHGQSRTVRPRVTQPPLRRLYQLFFLEGLGFKVWTYR